MDALTYVTRDTMTGIADAIREATGTTTTYKPSEMAEAIGNIGGVDLDEVETLLVDFYYDADLITLADGIIYQTRRLIVS